MSLTTGQLVGGHYEVVARLGGGGFGETYLSKDLHLPDRPIRVIKRLSPRSQETSVLQLSRRLFETEAQVLYRLGTHPQIPQLFAHFEELSEFYLVQEYINGKDLSHKFLRGKIWEQSAVVDLLENILTVLKFVHQNNVIHRDIKPENVIRRRDGQLFLIDFGVVKEIASSTLIATGESEPLTNYTVGIGTPGYTPSEQAHGEPKFASDIYAIGMMGIQALTGLQPSHLGKDENLEILWRQHAPKVYPEFAAILSRMVRFDFRQRYANAEIAHEAIKEFSDRHPISNINHSLATVLISSDINPSNPQIDNMRDRQANSPQNLLTLTPESTLESTPKSRFQEYIQPWHVGLGAITLSAIAMTTATLILTSPSKSTRSSDSNQIKEVMTSIPSASQSTPLTISSNSAPVVKEFSINNANDPNANDTSEEIYGITISPDSKVVAVAGSNRSIELWDLQTGKKLQTFKGNTGRVYDVFFSPDGQRIVSGSDDRKVMIWEVKTGRILNTLEGHQERVYTAIFSPDGKMIASSSSDRTIRLWNVETGKLINTFLEKSWVYDVSFTPDSKVLASGSKDGAIRLWNVETGQIIKNLVENGNGSAVRSIVYSNDGKLIASAMEDSTVRLWDATTGQLKEVFTGHTAPVHTIAFSNNDRLLASGSADKTVRIWSLKDKRSAQVLSDHERGVASVSFSADQKLLLSGSLDGKVKLWKLSAP